MRSLAIAAKNERVIWSLGDLMRPDKLSVHDLFQKERRYVVPLYQRPYVWNQDEQWLPLWDDIERQADAAMEAGEEGSRRSHFLGAVVLNVAKTVGASVARSEVIDGQQRLTTLQVFLAAMRDHAAAIGSPLASRLRRLTEHEDEREGSDAWFKVWPTNADRAVFRTVMMSRGPDALMRALEVDRRTAPRMAAAYLFFHDRIRDSVGTGEAAEARLKALLQALRSALQVVVIELEDEDDPQIIFETLNARGQPLLPSDLIRNYVFLQAATQKGADADDLYERYWRPFDDLRTAEAVDGEDRFWHQEERQGRLTRPRIDLFLFHYLVMQTERDLSIGQLFREFREWRAVHPGSIETLLADLKASSATFARLIEPTGMDRAAVLARRLKALDTSTVYPFLLHLLALPPERLPVERRDAIFEDLESWLVRRFMGWLTNKNYNRFFVALLQKVKRAPEDADLAEIVREELSRSGDPTTRWPTDAEFLDAWLTKPLYAKSRPDRSAMVLRALEERLHTRRNEAIGLPARLSIEHLLPQKGALRDYPYADGLVRRETEADEARRERMINTIGNLTLLTGELNASASNGPFAAKVGKIVDDSDLRLNAWLRRAPPETWDEEDILRRGEELFRTALTIWPRPMTEPENLADEESPPKGVWRFTETSTLQAKRQALIQALATREGVTLTPESIARYSDGAGRVRVVVAISKLHVDRGFPYWYGYKPQWQDYLAGANEGFLLLGCVDRDEGFAIPLSAFGPRLEALNNSPAKDGSIRHWHVHMVERAAGLALALPKIDQTLDLSPYRLTIGSEARPRV